MSDEPRWKMIPVKADSSLRREVRREADRRKVSVSELVREAVRRELRRGRDED